MRHVGTFVPPRPWSLGKGAVLLLGASGAAIAVALNSHEARAATNQDWPPFVLVTGLLLIGVIADADHLFSAFGEWLASITRHGVLLYLGALLMVAIVTSVLNLDTSVAFLTPVLVYTARRRGGGEAPLVYGCLLMSNASSLVLPGSNLTNLIVLGPLHLSGDRFVAKMGLAALTSIAVTGLVVGIFERRSLHASSFEPVEIERPVFGLGLMAVITAVALTVLLRSPALPIAIVGLLAVVIRVACRRSVLSDVRTVLDLPVLVGLFGFAVALGTLGRTWSGPADLLGHVNIWGTAAIAALSTVAVNNLPAASLLAARVPAHPLALLVGLNIGPNLFVTGSLAWVLWIKAAKQAGAQPSIWHASRLGLIAAPGAIGAAIGVLASAH